MSFNVAEKELLDYSQNHGLLYKSFVNVLPESYYQGYSTVFMTAMRPEFQWLYQGEIPTKIQDTISLGTCVRTNGGFSKEVLSDRHLKTFEMLMFCSARPYKESLPMAIDLIQKLLQEKGKLYARVFPTDVMSKEILASNKISFIDNDDCIFSGEKHQTNRSGFRIEFCAKGTLPSGKTVDWELMNTVLINSINGVPLDRPLLESAGCFERFLVFREGVDSVFETSSFNLTKMRNLLPDATKQQVFTLADLVRTAVMLSLSGYADCPKESRQNKTFSIVLTNLANFGVLNRFSQRDIDDIMAYEFSLIQQRKNVTDDEVMQYKKGCFLAREKLAQKEIAYRKICQYLNADKMMPMNTRIEKAAKRYNGGDLDFVTKIVNTQFRGRE